MTEGEMAGWHHQLNGHEFEQTLGVGDGQGGLVCCSPWGRKSQIRLSDWTELNDYMYFRFYIVFCEIQTFSTAITTMTSTTLKAPSIEATYTACPALHTSCTSSHLILPRSSNY